MLQFDYVIIGSGIAGLSFALKAARSGSVAIITKKAKAETNTAWAQGGIAAVTDEADSFEAHVRDTLDAGAGLCDEAVVRGIVRDGPERIRACRDALESRLAAWDAELAARWPEGGEIDAPRLDALGEAYAALARAR